MLCALSRQLLRLSLGVFILLNGAVRAQELQPVTTLDAEAYVGRWYQTHTTLGFILLELGGLCTTADYKLESANKISLINQSRPWLIPAFLARTTGYAVQSDEIAGVFTVSQQYLFAADPNVVFQPPGNYWIIGLGPIVDGQYQWAAVASPNRSAAWIIVRNVDDFYANYVDDALAVFAEAGGFNGLFNSLIPTGHFWCSY